jgi:hypothetical protein
MPAASTREGEAVLLLVQDCQKLHIGFPPLAMPHHELASDVVLEVIVCIAGLKPFQLKRMLAVDVAKHV